MKFFLEKHKFFSTENFITSNSFHAKEDELFCLEITSNNHTANL